MVLEAFLAEVARIAGIGVAVSGDHVFDPGPKIVEIRDHGAGSSRCAGCIEGRIADTGRLVVRIEGVTCFPDGNNGARGS